ncbi:MAG: transposase [Bacteroidota bacterium]
MQRLYHRHILYRYTNKPMNDKFKDKYRIPTARAVWWDYSHTGLYFVTICTHGMECCLGKIENNEMHLSETGKIAETCWIEIPDHFPFVKLHARTIMPNHVHGIIEILPNDRVEILPNVLVETLHATSLRPAHPARNQKMASISPPKGSLGSVIRSYKSAVSGKVHILHPQFGWQERYYDNIIKDVPAYQRIETYIRNNVRNWENDILFGK